jgi:gliding motility-associated-like protein
MTPLFATAQIDEGDTTDPENTETDDDVTPVSHIEIPNAFSPNDDDINDKLCVKSKTTVGIVEFRAIIFNRWGQKLYEWTDINDGWDGTYNGHPVKQGTYFVLVTAKGSDGQTHTIKRDVNLLRGKPYEEGRD